MKNIVHIFLLLLLLQSCAPKITQLNSGLYILQHQEYFGAGDNQDKPKLDSFWMHRNAVIQPVYITISSDTMDGRPLNKPKYVIWKYIYRDLETNICQDYSSLDENAKPVCNFKFD